MSFESGVKCEGLHDGRWFRCTILSREVDGYKVTFEGWSRRFDAVLTADCLRPCTTIECLGRKRSKPSAVNFNKLLPDDSIDIEVEGNRKSAIVKVVDSFLELVTVECENDQLVVSFSEVLPPLEDPVPVPVKKSRKPTASPLIMTSTTPSPVATAPPPAQYSSQMAPQFATIVRPDGEEISCGDLVTLSFSCADVVFAVLEIYEGASHEILLNARKYQLSDGVAVDLAANFSLTCPASAVFNVQRTPLSAQFRKLLLDIRQKSILRVSQSLQQHLSDRAYQLRVRRNGLASKFRSEIQKGMSTKAARSFSVKLGPADLHCDLELLELTIGNNFKVEKPKTRLSDLDPMLGEKWDVKLKQDDRFFYVTFTEFSLDVPSRSLIAKIKFAESTCAFRHASYRQDTAADCS